MKRILALIAGVAFALAGCNSGESELATPTFDEETMMEELNEVFPEEGTVPDSKMKEVKLTDPIKFDCYSHLPCDATYTPEKYVVSDACYGEVDSYGAGPELEPGTTYLQMSGVFEVHSASNGWTMMDDPQIITKDGFTELAGYSLNCGESGDYQSWSTTVDAGQKIRVFGAWIIPEDTEYMILSGVKMKLPKVDEAEEVSDLIEDEASTKATGETQEEPNLAETPSIVKCLEGTPGPTLMSDGSMQYTDHCFYSNGGPEYLEAESQSGLSPEQDPSNIPYADGGTCPAYLCGYGTDENGNPNPSSGELQTLHGCDEGYITDEELCSAVRDKASQYGW